MLVNLLIAVGIFVAYQKDTTMIIEKAVMPEQRLITPRIIEILIGATTVQLGAIAFGTFRAVFTKTGGTQWIQETMGERRPTLSPALPS